MEHKLTFLLKRIWMKLKCLRSSRTRVRKPLQRSSFKKIKFIVSFLIVFLSLVTLITYYFKSISLQTHKDIENVTQQVKLTAKKTRRIRRFKRMELVQRVVYKNETFINPDTEHLAKLIDTVGCKIPKAVMDYSKYIKRDTKKRYCGKRGIILSRFDENTVVASIKSDILIKYLKNKESFYDCCYQFIHKAVSTPPLTSQPKILSYSDCTKFQNNSRIPLQSEFIVVKCFEYIERQETRVIYDDMYAFVKKIKKVNVHTRCQSKYNVIMLGIDTMSKIRAEQLFPRTLSIFQRFYWIGFRGYHRVAEATFPNLMAVFSGKNLETIKKECSGRMDSCNKLMIWSRFRDAGYVTAYGAENMTPEKFSNNTKYGFKVPPTDHYMETLACTAKVCSAKQILDYGVDFAFTYRNELFFGLFWINSIGHEEDSRPQDGDIMLENFFLQLAETGVLSNTFIIFFSDHGIRYGEARLKMEAYYDERLPMFFMWVPLNFKKFYPNHVISITTNQLRLVTPYDIFSTLLHIRQMSLCSSNTFNEPPEGCPKCHSTFATISRFRRCKDVAISPKWCSCHKLFPLTRTSKGSRQVVDLVINNINSNIKTIETVRCWRCLNVSLQKIHRVNYFYAKNFKDMYYVVAFSVLPAKRSYEATVLKNLNEPKGTVVGAISLISKFNGLVNCTEPPNDYFCVCSKIANC